MRKLKFALAGVLVASSISMGTGFEVEAKNNVQTTELSESYYKDVSKNFWAHSVILWGTKEKIAYGYPDGTFKPNNLVSESEFIAMLIRAYKPENFKELEEKSHWADSYYLHTVKMNYPTAGARQSSKRGYVIDREYVAEIIAGTQGVNYRGKDAIRYLLANGLAKGKKPGVVSISNYEGEGQLTRAEAIQFIKNVLENGVKDKDGNPIMKHRPKTPSDPKDLPPLPGENEKKEPTKPNPKPNNNNNKPTNPDLKPTEPNTNLGKVKAQDLFNKTKGYAQELGFTDTGFEFTSGYFKEKNASVAAVGFFDRPEYGSISITVRDWNDSKAVSLFKRTVENYGVDSNALLAEFNKISVSKDKKVDAKQYKAQGTVFVIKKTLNNDGRVDGSFVIHYDESM